MQRIFTVFSLGLLLLSLSPNLAEGLTLFDYFYNASSGTDPDGQDTVYVVCGSLGGSQQVIQVRMKTDNQDPAYALAAAVMPLRITVDQPGVTLDTTIASTFGGTALAEWELQLVVIQTAGDNPSVFPMTVAIGGVDFDDDELGPGDYLVANLVFSVSGPTNICVDTTSYPLSGPPFVVVLQVATTGSQTIPVVDYTPGWVGECCGPSVPTLTEWGLVAFSILLLGTIAFYLRRRRLQPQY